MSQADPCTRIDDVGLVLEGGGLRGAYTAGVLDAFMDAELHFPYVIGVSAGSNAGADYVAWQRERNHKMFVELVADPRYTGWRTLLRERSWFGMEFLFETAPDEVAPFDYEAFVRSPKTFVVAATACDTGLPTYFRHHEHDPRWFVRVVHRASCSIPMLSPPVTIDGRRYVDGGVSDPIPIERAVHDGCRRNVVVLTRNAGYRKRSSLLNPAMGLALLQYPGLRSVLLQRHEKYNACRDRLFEREATGQAFLIYPREPLRVHGTRGDIPELETLYEQGYGETMARLSELRAWLQTSPQTATESSPQN